MLREVGLHTVQPMAPAELNERQPLQTAELDQVPRSAFKVSLGGLFGLIAALGTQMFIASLFGAGAAMDAFLTALAIPVYLQAILLGGLSFVIIPAFIEDKVSGREEDAWALVGTLFWLTCGILIIIAIGGALLAPRIIAISAPGLGPDKAELTARMLSILMFAVPLTGLGSLATGIQNAQSNFFWPAARAAFGSIANLLVLALFYRTMGPMALAWGYLAGAAVQASVPVVPVLRHGWTRLVPFDDHRLLQMGRLIAPFILFGVFTRAVPVIERYFAAGLPDGDLSYLGYAEKLSRAFRVILGAGIVTAIFPLMSQGYAQDGVAGLERTVGYGVRLTLAVGLPIVAILSAVALPLTKILFERGAFTPIATLQVSRIVPIFIIDVVLFSMIGNLITRTFYAVKDTKTVPIIGAVLIMVYIGLSTLLVNPWGYMGLAIARMLRGGIMILVLIILLLRRLKSFPAPKTTLHLLAYSLASLATFIIAKLILLELTQLPALMQLSISCIVSGAFYMAILFRVDSTMAMAILELTGVKRVIEVPSVQRILVKTMDGFRRTSKGGFK